MMFLTMTRLETTQKKTMSTLVMMATYCQCGNTGGRFQ